MKRLVRCAAAFVLATMFYGGAANAQATRTWVSGVGDDANPCSRTAPCKTFAGAISKTAAGGEINCLDPGGFGSVTITKSMTIDCTGTFGSILASSTNGVVVNDSATATPGTVRVVLRGLAINGAPPTAPGLNGIRFVSGASLTVENVIIENFAAGSPNGFGISFRPPAGQLGRLIVRNTAIINNGSTSTGGGILIQPTGAGNGAQVTLSHVSISGNANGAGGLVVDTVGTSGLGVAVTVDNSRIANSVNGISVTSNATSAVASVVVSDSVIFNNGTNGVVATGNNAQARLSNSVITNNGTGIAPTGGGFIRSIGGNLLDANGTNGTFSDTISKV